MIGHQNSSAADGNGVSRRRSPLIFIDHGVKINVEYYRENVLKTTLKPWADKHFGRRAPTFQQDSVLSHLIRVNQERLKKEVPRFSSTVHNLCISICWALEPDAFWIVRFPLKNTKVSIMSRPRRAGNGPKYRRVLFVQPLMALSAV